jgi:vesicle-associated membrane protein 7
LFAKNIEEKIKEFNKIATEPSKMKIIQDKVQQTHQIMLENIDKLFERGEKVELLVVKTKNMN